MIGGLGSGWTGWGRGHDQRHLTCSSRTYGCSKSATNASALGDKATQCIVSLGLEVGCTVASVSASWPLAALQRALVDPVVMYRSGKMLPRVLFSHLFSNTIHLLKHNRSDAFEIFIFV